MTRRPPRFWVSLLGLWPALAYFNQWLVTPDGGIPTFSALGAGAAVVAWYFSVRFSIKTRVALFAYLLLGAMGGLALQFLDHTVWPSQILGSDRWVLWRQSAEAWLAAFTTVASLRSLSWRFPSLAVLELAAAGGIFVQALEAHRDGYINRPFQIVDPLWLRGLDPTPMFLAVGSLGLVAGCVMALNRPGNRRPWWDLPLLILVLSVLYLLSPSATVKQLFEKFGMGKLPGDENRLSPEGGMKTPGPPSSGDSKNSPKDQDDPSFEDSPPPKPRPVAVVIFRDDYEPPSGAYYFRQTSNSQFNGLKLVHSNDDRFDRDNALSFPTRPDQGKGLAESLGMQLPAWNPTHFQSLSMRIALLEQHPRPFGLVNPERYWALPNPDPGRFQKAYEVDCKVFRGPYTNLLSLVAGASDWDDSTWNHYLEGPKDRRYRELADEIVGRLPEGKRDLALFRAVAIKQWLDDNTIYSLKSPSAQAADPVSDYLFGQRIGYCVFTSHSACYLYRAAGIPARISSGYMVAAKQRGGGSSLLIRSSDAHSWPEIYLQGMGWMDLDIAPKKNLEPEHEQVDNNLQQMMGDMARKNKQETRPEEDRPAIDLQQLMARFLRQTLSAVPWGLLAVWLVLSSWKLFRRLAPFFWRGRGLARVAYVAILDVLAEQGVTRHPQESCEAFARRLLEEVPALLDLVQIHLGLRLSPKPAPADPEVRALFKDCLAQVADRKVKGWRRYLGWLDPTSGLRVR